MRKIILTLSLVVLSGVSNAYDYVEAKCAYDQSNVIRVRQYSLISGGFTTQFDTYQLNSSPSVDKELTVNTDFTIEFATYQLNVFPSVDKKLSINSKKGFIRIIGDELLIDVSKLKHKSVKKLLFNLDTKLVRFINHYGSVKECTVYLSNNEVKNAAGRSNKPLSVFFH
jgi:hypothetical protein